MERTNTISPAVRRLIELKQQRRFAKLYSGNNIEPPDEATNELIKEMVKWIIERIAKDDEYAEIMKYKMEIEEKMKARSIFVNSEDILGKGSLIKGYF